MRPISWNMVILVALLAAFVAVAVACGAAEQPPAPTPMPPAPAPTPAPAQFPTQQPQQPQQPAPAAPAPTAVSAPAVAPAPTTPAGVATPRPAPTQAPASTRPSGTLRVGLATIAVPLFRNGVAPYPRNHYHWGFGVCETLTSWKPGTTEQGPMVAESWAFAPDFKELVVRVRPGIQFHKGYGEVTAEDVAFSYNDAGADNPETTHDNGVEIRTTYHPWVVRDKYTAVGPIETVRRKIGEWDINREGQSGAPCIFSKKVFDSVGAEAAVTTMVATGPYEAREWVAGQRFVGEAVENHYRIVPRFKTLTVLEVPEETTRTAALATGDVDIAELSLKNVKASVSKGFVANESLGLSWTNAIYFGGNYWMEKDTQGNTVFPRPGFKPDDQHPWIGDPRDPARMERARKVRTALSMAIDREAIHETIMDRLGNVAYMIAIPTTSPLFKDKWKIPYDPEGARKLLAEAGFPRGFEMPYFYPPDFGLISPEAAEAVAAMWSDIGIKVNIEKTAYTTRRPTLIQRQIDIPWYWFVDQDLVDYDPFNAWLMSAQPGWNGGMEFQELWDFRQQLLDAIGARDLVKRNEVLEKRADWLHQQMVYAPVVDLPKLFVENPRRVKNWRMYMNIAGVPNNFEVAEPAAP